MSDLKAYWLVTGWCNLHPDFITYLSQEKETEDSAIGGWHAHILEVLGCGWDKDGVKTGPHQDSFNIVEASYSESPILPAPDKPDDEEDADDEAPREKPLNGDYIMVQFFPQLWQGPNKDYTVNVDPFGPDTWEVHIDRLKGIKPMTHESDSLATEDDAPAWVRQWALHHPFEVDWDETLVP